MRERAAVGLSLAGRVVTGAAAILLVAIVGPQTAVAASGAATPVRAAGAVGAGDTVATRQEFGGEPEAVAALRERVGRQGYLLREVRWDPVLRQSWAVLESVGHPERPYVSVLVPLSARDMSFAGAQSGVASSGQFTQAGLHAGSNQFALAPVVHVGDQVTLWSEEQNLHVQLTAVAEQNGAVGDRIRLHILGVSMGWEQTPQRLTGTVRGAGSVEMTQ